MRHAVRPLLRVDQDLVAVQGDGRVALCLVRFLIARRNDVEACDWALFGVFRLRVADGVLRGSCGAARFGALGARAFNTGSPCLLQE